MFQFFHLLQHLSVEENVLVPALVAGDRLRDAAAARASSWSAWTSPRAHGTRSRLSGGEMQRVALCRALLRRPRLLLADEPTGNLDEESGERVMDLLLGLARDEGSAVLFVTHSRELASRADEVWTLHSGAREA